MKGSGTVELGIKMGLVMCKVTVKKAECRKGSAGCFARCRLCSPFGWAACGSSGCICALGRRVVMDYIVAAL